MIEGHDRVKMVVNVESSFETPTLRGMRQETNSSSSSVYGTCAFRHCLIVAHLEIVIRWIKRDTTTAPGK